MSSRDEYRAVYKDLQMMTEPGRRLYTPHGLEYAFGNGVSQHKKSLVTLAPRVILPGMYSFDREVLNFTSEFADAVDDACPVDLDANGFSKHGMFSNFQRLNTVTGFMGSDMSYPIMDNALIREEYGLLPGYLPWQKQIAEEVWREIWSEYTPTDINVPDGSAGGPRRNTKTATWKADFAGYLFEAPTFEKMLKAVAARDWLTLANEFETLYMMYIQKRDQVDTPGKVRMANSLEFARTSGKSGHRFEIDKSVVIDGVAWHNKSATRARVVHAGPWVINCFLQIIASGTMHSMFTRFPELYHTNTPDQIVTAINGHYIFASDVTEFDSTASADAINTALDVGCEFWDPRLMEAARYLFFSPYYARSLHRGEDGGDWVGDPRQLKAQVITGNRSGHAFTSLLNKGNKVIDSLFIQHKIGVRVIGNVRKLMRNEGLFKMLNNGDDEITATKNAAAMADFKKERGNLHSGHYKVSPEPGNGFSGYLIMFDDEASLTYKCKNKDTRTFEQIYCHERSIGGVMRPFWPIGHLDRINRRDSSELSAKIWDIHDRVYSKHLAPKYGHYVDLIVNAAVGMDKTMVDGLTAIDKEVLEEPSKLMYKYLEKDVNPDVFRMVTSKYKWPLFEHIFTTYYKGVIK